MRIGIVGSEAKKFTNESEKEARALIRILIRDYDEVCSGECHLGGIDIWAKEESIKAGKKFIPFPPQSLSWEHYKARNMQIANSDTCVCITVDKLPDHYDGMKFDLCYHCRTSGHVKSGGCWTVKHAKKLGHKGWVEVIKT